jgi:hypothetical protein
VKAPVQTSQHKAPPPELLVQLQEEFKRYLLIPNAEAINWVDLPPRGKENDRMEVYSNAYRIRLLDVFAEHYATIKILIGDENFRSLGLAYLTQHPSTYANIRYFGDQLSQFLQHNPEHYGPELVELAQFEWALTEAVDAADATIVSSDMIARLEPEEWPQIHLHFHPSVQLFWFHWNVTEVWLAAKEKQPLPAWQQAETAIPCLIWRYEQGAFYQTIDSLDAQVITRYFENASFEEICEELLDQLPEEIIPQRMAEILQFLLGRTAISNVVLS